MNDIINDINDIIDDNKMNSFARKPDGLLVSFSLVGFLKCNSYILSTDYSPYSFRRKGLVLNISFTESFILNESKTWSIGSKRYIYALLKRFRFYYV